MDGQIVESQLTFAGHIHELRRRLTWPALLLMVGAGAAFFFHDKLITFLTKPLNQTLYYSNPAGSFNFIMKVCFILGITIAIPALIYNLISFIEPAVEKQITRKLITTVSLLSLTLGVAGAAFAYYAALPMSLQFFQGVKLTGVDPLISADAYLNFALTCILTFILLFQLPLLVLFINHIKPMSPRKLLKYERHVIVGSLAIALVLPFSYDPLTQFMIAVPIIVLYNLSIMMVYMANGKYRKAARAQQKAAVKRPVALLPKVPKVSLARSVFIEPVLLQPATTTTARSRPVFDVAGRTMPVGNFLDLRPSK